MVVRERFSIAELVARTRVPPASIHHYLRLGLLPPPRRVAPNRFLYDERHVQSLRLIRMLRERRRLPLDVIRRILPDLVGLRREEAFRPEMWDQAVGLHLGRAGRRAPSARLLEAARDAFAKRGYGDVNVDDICRAAGIAKGSFYRHYRSKEELFFAAASSAAAEVADAFARAVGGGPIPEDAAVEVLARSLQPHLPLFLDLFARALQRRPGYRSTARRVYGELAAEVGRRLRGTADPVASGGGVVQRAVSRVFERMLEAAPASEEIVGAAERA